MYPQALTLSSAAVPGGAPPLAIGTAALLLSFLIASLLVWLLRRNRISLLRILDQPNARSLHHAPVPRTGGVGVLAGVAGGLALALPWLPTPGIGWAVAAVVLATALLAGVSLFDDRHHVPARYRLAAQLVAAVLVMAAGVVWRTLGLPGLAGLMLPLWLAPALTLLFVVWMTNLYNFMDGMDGLAGGMAVFGFGALALLGLLAGAPDYALVAAVIAAAAGGFLLHNLPRAAIFLGDVGSTVLGFWAAVLLLWGAGRGLFPLWLGVLVFSPFAVDATWTLLVRFARGAPVWEAHREHHYQRLVLAGWSTWRTLFWAYVLMGAAAASAIGARSLMPSEQWLLLAGWAGLYSLVHWRVGLVERERPASPERS
ncbi:glycosyltransferase family 4 protein [uncultured Thiohalocapsa sp.]|uniref:MraY family glycosyltransferase n=1 Tax=uncultured Thiohalocapsa sp. TaxID=768990 RepID=UPI0026006BB8|nr:glycosyltransferase family 4 protein [uncultured Thiohalocapsa sp.]